MSAFTSGGFDPLADEVATLKRGSNLTDGYYRVARQQQLAEDFSVLYVYLEGWFKGSGLSVDRAGMTAQDAFSLYRVSKSTGMTHGEALDEVFLTGYVAGRGYDHRITEADVRRLLS